MELKQKSWWDEYRKEEAKASKELEKYCNKLNRERREPHEFSRLKISYRKIKKVGCFACA